MKNKINNVLSIIKSGHLLKDKLVLLLYFMVWPLRRTIIKNMKLITKVIVKNSDGIFYCDKDFSAVDCIDPHFEENLRRVFHNIRRGILIDIGANVGKYTIMVGRRIAGKVISIEPEKKNFDILKKNIKLNNLKNVIALNIGCSSRNEKRKFFLDEKGVGRHSFYKIKLGDNNKFIYINTQKLDDIILKNLTKEEIKEISLIKIDVEGAEAEVLRGTKKTLKRFHPKILIEVWDKEALKMVRKILLPLKYKEEKLDKENYLYKK